MQVTASVVVEQAEVYDLLLIVIHVIMYPISSFRDMSIQAETHVSIHLISVM